DIDRIQVAVVVMGTRAVAKCRCVTDNHGAIVQVTGPRSCRKPTRDWRTHGGRARAENSQEFFTRIGIGIDDFPPGLSDHVELAERWLGCKAPAWVFRC